MAYLSPNKVDQNGGGQCGCLYPDNNEDSCLARWGEFLVAAACPCVVFGQGMHRAGHGSTIGWAIACATCGTCGVAAHGVNLVNEQLGGDDLFVEFCVQYACCCCCTWMCATANFQRAVRRKFEDKDKDGLGDDVLVPAPEEMERDNYFDDIDGKEQQGRKSIASLASKSSKASVKSSGKRISAHNPSFCGSLPDNEQDSEA